MRSKWLMGTFAVIGVAALAGIGFATYTASASTVINGSAGSFYLSQSASLGSSSLSSASGSCSASAPGAAITVSASNLLPGDFCNFTVVVTDPGSIGGDFLGYLGACSGPCSQLSANVGNVGTYYTLEPFSGNSDTYFVLVTDTGSGMVSESDTWLLPITGTPV